MLKTLTQDEVLTTINGPVGQLEIASGEPLGTDKKSWAIVCHPHSLHGGTMYNKVVTTLVKTFRDKGMSTVRFNFRGVGKSAGKYDEGRGECDDLISVMNWALSEKAQYQIYLAGFSFGAYVASLAATRIPVARLIAVAPPVIHFRMEQLPPILSPWILVQGGKDEVVSAKAVLAWAKGREPEPTIVLLKEASHFFHGQLIELRESLAAVL